MGELRASGTLAPRPIYIPGCITVAASDASPQSKYNADFTCDGTADDVEINEAIEALPATFAGTVVLSEGNFSITGTIVVESNVTLGGQGHLSTRITGATGLTTAVIKIPKGSSGATVRRMYANANSLSGVSGIYIEATNGGSDIVMQTLLDDLDIRNADDSTSCYAIKIDALYKSHLRMIHIYNCANGILWDDITTGTGGNSRVDHVFARLNVNDGIGLEFKNCSHIYGSRVQVGQSGATGTTGFKFYGAHEVHINEVDVEDVHTAVLLDGASTGSTASQHVVLDGGLLHSGSNAGKGVHITANALYSVLKHLAIIGTTGGTSVGIDDYVTAAGAASRIRDCYVLDFDTPVSVASAATLDNVTGCTIANITDPGNGGAIPVTISGDVTLVTGGAETRTLAIPAFVGQEIHLSLKTDGGDCAVTVAGPVNVAGNNTLTFDNESEHILLKAIDANGTLEWCVMANDGVGLSTV